MFHDKRITCNIAEHWRFNAYNNVDVGIRSYSMLQCTYRISWLILYFKIILDLSAWRASDRFGSHKVSGRHAILIIIVDY